MSKKHNALIVFVLASAPLLAAVLSACSVTVDRYAPFPPNVELMKQLQIKSIAVDKFESLPPGLYSLSGCRSRSSIQTPSGLSFASYLERAFIDELRLAGLYDPAADFTVHGRLDKISFESGVPTGNWAMTVSLASNRGPGFSIESIYRFPTSVVASTACRQVAEAYPAAVRQLIGQVASDPRFKELLHD